MEDTRELSFERMQEMQKKLQARYAGVWHELCPEYGRSSLLWMLGEVTECSDIIKKEGDRAIMENAETRRHFVEELADVMMYFNDLMLCYGVTPDELKTEYLKKHERNMNRWKTE